MKARRKLKGSSIGIQEQLTAFKLPLTEKVRKLFKKDWNWYILKEGKILSKRFLNKDILKNKDIFKNKVENPLGLNVNWHYRYFFEKQHHHNMLKKKVKKKLNASKYTKKRNDRDAQE